MDNELLVARLVLLLGFILAIICVIYGPFFKAALVVISVVGMAKALEQMIREKGQ